MPGRLVELLNDKLGTSYASNDYLRWRRGLHNGGRNPPPKVRNLMIKDVLQYEFGDKVGAKPAELFAI